MAQGSQGSGAAGSARLSSIAVDDWPPLAWAAVATARHGSVALLHGPCVEVSPAWAAEAVWDGDYARGDFDTTDLVSGTGVRIRDNDVCFVSSGDTLNRLHWYQADGRTIVSNSLPALLAVANLDLVDGYPYADAMTSIANGLHSYQREIPSTRGPIHVVYFDNVVLRHGTMVEVRKPSGAPDFVDFAAYREFLYEAARRIGRNAMASGRAHVVNMLTTVSSGYDSGATSVIAREAGAREAVTMQRGRREASNLFSLDDSGAAVAGQLGLSCRVYDRYRDDYPFEDAAWASMGNVGDANLAVFDYPRPVCLLFAGFMGDTIWSKEVEQPEPLRRNGSPSGARFNELRLELGVMVCAPVFWGCQKEGQILRLSHLPEMRPWTLGGGYDRPIPRRLLEEAGVRRGTFAVRKRVSSFNRRFGRPLSESLRGDFAQFLSRRQLRPRSWPAEQTALILDGIDWTVLRHLPASVRFSCRGWVWLPSASDFFAWATERCKRRCLRGLAGLDL